MNYQTKIDMNTAYSLAGEALVNATRKAYSNWREKPNKANTTKYLKLRLNLHLKMNNWPYLLQTLDDELNLGLYDTGPGELFWGVK